MNNNYYTKETMERFLDPKHFGEMKDASGVGEVGNPRCGDQMKVYIKVKDGKIEKASFQTLGCAAAIATSDVICEMITGRKIEDALKITEEEMIKALKKLPSVKIHCSSLAIEGLKKAIDDYKKR
jgi:nitrogen fixation protein NifU and related proteins